MEDGGWVKKRIYNPPPFELELAWQCKQFNCLPYSGGLLDQPAGLVKRMAIAYNVWEAIKTRHEYGSKYDEFIKDHPNMHEICKQVEELRNGNQRTTNHN